MKVEIGQCKLMIVSIYGPGVNIVRTEFLESLTNCVKKFGENARHVILGDLNERVGDKEIDEITKGVSTWDKC